MQCARTAQGCQLALGWMTTRWSTGKVAWQKIALLNLSCSKTAVLSWYRLISVWLFQLLFGSWSPVLCNFSLQHQNPTACIFIRQVRIQQADCCSLCSVSHCKPCLDDSHESWLASLHLGHHPTTANAVEGWGPASCFWAMQAQIGSEGLSSASSPFPQHKLGYRLLSMKEIAIMLCLRYIQKVNAVWKMPILRDLDLTRFFVPSTVQHYLFC